MVFMIKDLAVVALGESGDAETCPCASCATGSTTCLAASGWLRAGFKPDLHLLKQQLRNVLAQ
jgi:hypothetical protein